MNNKDKKIGKFLTIKEARTSMRELDVQYKVNGESYRPLPIYREPDGSFSIVEPVKSTAVIVDYVDANSGRRFKKEKINGNYYYVPVKKCQRISPLRVY